MQSKKAFHLFQSSCNLGSSLLLFTLTLDKELHLLLLRKSREKVQPVGKKKSVLNKICQKKTSLYIQDVKFLYLRHTFSN